MRILIANPFGIGDVLFSLPLVRALKRSDPGLFLGYLCNRRTEELVARWPELNWRMTFEKDEFRAAWRDSKGRGLRFLGRTLRSVREQQFDLLVDLSLGWHAGFAGLLCGIRRRIGFDFKGRGRFLTDTLPLNGFFSRPVAEHYLDLLEPLGLSRPSPEPAGLTLPAAAAQQLERLMLENKIPAAARFAGIVPGGGASWGANAHYKQWPAERFAQVADDLRMRHGLQGVLIGDAKDLPLCEEVARRMKHPPLWTAQPPSLLLLAELLRRCRLIIGNDGGAMHLAAAIGTPTVTLFGPVDASVYGPYPGSPFHRTVAKGLACRPCYRNFRLPPCPWNNACLKELETEPVLRAADELLR